MPTIFLTATDTHTAGKMARRLSVKRCSLYNLLAIILSAMHIWFFFRVFGCSIRAEVQRPSKTHPLGVGYEVWLRGPSRLTWPIALAALGRGPARAEKEIPHDSLLFRAPDSRSKDCEFESRQERRELTLCSVSVPPPCYRSGTLKTPVILPKVQVASYT